MRGLRGAGLTLIIALAIGHGLHAGEAEPVTRYTGACWWIGGRFECTDRWVRGGRFVPPVVEVDHEEDWSGRWVVPPFGEGHNHDLADSRVDRFSPRYLAAGVLYGFCPGNTPASRELATVARAERQGPQLRVAYTDGLITAPGGHPWGLAVRNEVLGIFPAGDSEGTFIHSVTKETDLEAAWARIAAQPWVKIVLVASESYDERAGRRSAFSTYGLDPELAVGIVARAHAAGQRVVAHVDTAEDFRVAVAAGVDLIAHLPGFRMTDPELDLAQDCCRLSGADAIAAAGAGTAVTTTLGSTLAFLDGDEAPADAERIRESLLHNLEVLKEAGVPLVIGSDAYGADPGSEARELLRHGALSTSELIDSWSMTTPRVLFPQPSLGDLTPGAPASFVVLDRDPLEDSSALFEVQALYVDGAEATTRE